MDVLKGPKSNESYSAKDIEVLEGLEPVRKRPGMYIGGTDENALHHLATEILDNAMVYLIERVNYNTKDIGAIISSMNPDN